MAQQRKDTPFRLGVASEQLGVVGSLYVPRTPEEIEEALRYAWSLVEESRLREARIVIERLAQNLRNQITSENPTLLRGLAQTYHTAGYIVSEATKAGESYEAMLYQLIDRNRQHLRQWMPWLDSEQSVDDLLVFMKESRLQFAHNQGFQAGIWHQGQIVGAVGFHNLDWVDRKVEMGYWLSADQQGKGLVTNVCKTLVNFAFDEYQLKKVEIHCATGNHRSCAIPKRLGFKQEGILRQAQWLYDRYVDMVIYGILASEWIR